MRKIQWQPAKRFCKVWQQMEAYLLQLVIQRWTWILTHWKIASYQEVAKLVLSAFLDDFTAEELDYCITNAYDSKFDTPAIAPLVKLDGQYNLELFHGSTIAFKDMALSILPYFMTTAAKKHGLENKIVILTATSGDTGKAAMAGISRMSQVLKLSFFIQKTVSARYKSYKWPLKRAKIPMLSLLMETLTMLRLMWNICSMMWLFVRNWQPTSSSFHQLTLWISVV